MSVEDADPPEVSVTGLGLNVTVKPRTDEDASVTVPVKALSELRVMVEVPAFPLAIDREPGDAEIEKSGEVLANVAVSVIAPFIVTVAGLFVPVKLPLPEPVQPVNE